MSLAEIDHLMRVGHQLAGIAPDIRGLVEVPVPEIKSACATEDVSISLRAQKRLVCMEVGRHRNGACGDQPAKPQENPG